MFLKNIIQYNILPFLIISSFICKQFIPYFIIKAHSHIPKCLGTLILISWLCPNTTSLVSVSTLLSPLISLTVTIRDLSWPAANNPWPVKSCWSSLIRWSTTVKLELGLIWVGVTILYCLETKKSNHFVKNTKTF